MSLVLRHNPSVIGIELDENGWVLVSELLEKMAAHGQRIDFSFLERVVAENDKQRFKLSADGTKIRANQGHSVKIDLALSPVLPPDILYHGTALHFLESIKKQGLRPQSRQHVHLSKEYDTAIAVGSRHGSPHILIIQAAKMHENGYVFYQADNGVWLTDSVPIDYIEF
jgi:putative RNA 2'-phosphotransferase